MSDNEAKLIRDCAGLYASFASEAASSLALFLMFSYITLRLTAKTELNSPGRAVLRWLWVNITDYLKDFWDNFKQWPDMQKIDLQNRLAFCRKMNIAICVFSAFVAFISLTRWMHIGNINGFRYLGYCVTCPIMQGELIVLIAPRVPFFRLTVLVSTIITAAVMISGYWASMYSGVLWRGELSSVIETWSFDGLVLEDKFWVVMPSFVGLGFLTFVQGPYLSFIYMCGCGPKQEMPKMYLWLVLLVGVTWMGFPIWWLLSSEGAGIIKDTKLNGWGFVTLNIISKGGFTQTMIMIVRASRPKTRASSATFMDEVPYWLMTLKKHDTGVHFASFDHDVEEGLKGTMDKDYAALEDHRPSEGKELGADPTKNGLLGAEYFHKGLNGEQAYERLQEDYRILVDVLKDLSAKVDAISQCQATSMMHQEATGAPAVQLRDVVSAALLTPAGMRAQQLLASPANGKTAHQLRDVATADPYLASHAGVAVAAPAAGCAFAPAPASAPVQAAPAYPDRDQTLV